MFIRERPQESDKISALFPRQTKASDLVVDLWQVEAVASSAPATPGAPAGTSAGTAPNAAAAAPPAVASGLEFPGFEDTEGQEDPETGLIWVFPPEPLPADKKGRMREPCCWPPCNKYARPNSKYCSRNCSNKNARARYAKRKK